MEGLIQSLKTNLPYFNGHAEACHWFKTRFDDRFVLKGCGTVNSENIYFYYLITDADCYTKGIRELTQKGIVSGFEFPMSHIIVGIMEDGGIHIIY